MWLSGVSVALRVIAFRIMLHNAPCVNYMQNYGHLRGRAPRAYKIPGYGPISLIMVYKIILCRIEITMTTYAPYSSLSRIRQRPPKSAPPAENRRI